MTSDLSADERLSARRDVGKTNGGEKGIPRLASTRAGEATSGIPATGTILSVYFRSTENGENGQSRDDQ